MLVCSGKALTFAAPLKEIKRLVLGIEELTISATPCFSRKLDKDKPQVDWTKDGLALAKKSLEKQVTNANSERGILERAITRYMEYYNASCEQKYKFVRYTNELRVLNALRDTEKARTNQKAQDIKDFKVAATKGYAEREEAKEAIKRKAPTVWEERTRTVFDD